MSSRSRISATFLCFLGFVLGLQALPLLCHRRELLVKTLSGVTAIATASPAFSEEELMISLESAAAQLWNGEADPLSHRLNYPHPGLRKRASPVTSFGSDLETVADALVRGMKTNASMTVQYGIDARIIVLKGIAAPNGSSFVQSNDVPITVFCNPTILARSNEDKMIQWREYCLVVANTVVWPKEEHPKPETPGSKLASKTHQALLEVDLLRDSEVEVAAQDITGKPIRISLSGETSQAFQHELDHLNGILIVDHAGLEDLPPGIAFLEEPFHAVRQKKTFERSIYQGNGPLYY
uniref:Peptide deformylase n=1 Tax=Ditylum brightwellii TaxID=49249 RepID=A0A7S4W3Q5_9STRA